MTTRYVGTGGSDANNGLSWANRLTIYTAFVANYAMNGRNRCFKNAANCQLAPSAFLMQVAHGTHLFVSESCKRVGFPTRMNHAHDLAVLSANRLPPLFDLILHIVRRCAHEQVCRVATRPIVASVTNEHPIRDWAYSNFIRKAMGIHSRIACRIKSAVSIMVSVSSVSPAPTVALRTVYLAPKSCNRVAFFAGASMPVDITQWLTLHMPEGCFCLSGDFCSSPAPTAAKTKAVRPIVFGRLRFHNQPSLKHIVNKYIPTQEIPQTWQSSM